MSPLNDWQLNLHTAEAMWLPVKSTESPASFPKRKAKLMYEDPVTGKATEWNPVNNPDQAMKLLMAFHLRIFHYTELDKTRYVGAHERWNTGNSEWEKVYTQVDPQNPAKSLCRAICKAVVHEHQNGRIPTK